MSADLFAEFGSSLDSGATQSKQPQSKPPSANDPFAYLFSPASQTASPQVYQSPQQWPSISSQQSTGSPWGVSGLGSSVVTPSVAHAGQQAPAQDSGDDEEGWGDFEEAQATIPAKPATTTTTIPSSNSSFSQAAARPAPKPVSEPPVRNRIYRAPTLDLMSNHLVALGGPSTPEPWQARPSWEKPAAIKPQPTQTPQSSTWKPPVEAAKSKKVNTDVLFDADDFDGAPGDSEDDFGDFETGEQEQEHAPAPAPAPAPATAAIPAQTAMADLLSLDFEAPVPQAASAIPSTSVPSSTRKEPPSQLLSTLSISSSKLSPSPLYPQAPRSPSFTERNPFPGLAVTTPISGTFPTELKDETREKSPSPVTAWPEAQSPTNKDDWDAFADFPPDASSATPGGAVSSWDWDAVDAPKAVPRRPSSEATQRKSSAQEIIGPPPTNVPPPSILLSVFPEVLDDIDAKLYKSTAKQTADVKSRIYADPATLAYLRGFLAIATVAARILAGRKKRWSRDKFLSQSMSISAAGAKGGMKLAGIDKAQTVREDREAADVVGIWRDHVGKLRSSVAAANIGIQKQVVKLAPLKVPEINDHMAVTTAKFVPTAPRPCVVCGLKRDERVKGVDFEVEDSFGEWWVEHWGHRACRNFWLGNEEKLRSR